MEYVLLVNGRVPTPVHTLTSSTPPLMWPLPSAVKLPARAKKVEKPGLGPQSSVPLIENAYCPFKLALEKFPVGGGGGGPTTVVPLLQAAVIEPSKMVANRVRRWMEAFIAHLLGWRAGRAGQETAREPRRERAARPSRFAA